MRYSVNPLDRAELRRLARERLGNPAPEPLSASARQIQLLLEALAMQRIELEIQNDYLQETCARVQLALDHSLERYDFAPVGCISTDARGIINSVNMAGARMLGAPITELVQQPFESFLAPAQRPLFRTLLARTLAQVENQHCDALALLTQPLPGRCIQLDMGPLPGAQGCQLVLSDTTASKVLEKQLRHDAERCSLAMEAVGDCLWECNLLTGRASYSRQFTHLYGFSTEEFGHTLDDWRQLIHPDDQGCFVKGVQECLAAQVGHFACKLRVRCKNGAYKWILCRGAVSSRSADGKPECLQGMHTDITAFIPQQL